VIHNKIQGNPNLKKFFLPVRHAEVLVALLASSPAFGRFNETQSRSGCLPE
jgi:hypothetical protein